MGDTNAYKEFRVIYLEYPINEMLPYCKLMAEKFAYYPAYWDYYVVKYQLSNRESECLKRLGNAEYSEAVFTLKMAARTKVEYALLKINECGLDTTAIERVSLLGD